MRKFTLLLPFLVFLIFPTLTLAQSSNSNSNGVENQNQIQTQNQEENKELAQEVSTGSAAVRDYMNAISQKAEEFLEEKREDTLGERVREVAQNQVQIQEKIQGELQKLEVRTGFLRKILGPSKSAIRNLNQQIQQNRIQIEKLELVKNEALKLADKNAIQEMIGDLDSANQLLEEKIEEEKADPGIIGKILNFLNPQTTG